jgi:syntaxin 5
VQGIEKSINVIGHIFQQLNHMIAEQGETVQRIDANIEDMGFKIERGPPGTDQVLQVRVD